MSCYLITHTHSAMPKDYVATCIKHAHTEDDAVKFLVKYDKKLKIVIDKRGSVFRIIDIKQI